MQVFALNVGSRVVVLARRNTLFSCSSSDTVNMSCLSLGVLLDKRHGVSVPTFSLVPE
jgi:hypothetical protein